MNYIYATLLVYWFKYTLPYLHPITTWNKTYHDSLALDFPRSTSAIYEDIKAWFIRRISAVSNLIHLNAAEMRLSIQTSHLCPT